MFYLSFIIDVLSMATALDDFIAPDCRFVNIKKGQMVYVYSKLIPAEGSGVFWSGSVCALMFYLIIQFFKNKKYQFFHVVLVFTECYKSNFIKCPDMFHYKCQA